MIWFINKIDTEIVAIHYNIHGNSDSYGSKWMLLIFAAISLILSLVFLFFKNLTKNSQNKNHDNLAENKIISIIIFFFMIISWIIIFATVKNSQKLEAWALPGVVATLGLLIICISALMPKLNQNKFMGIRTTATLKSEEVWRKAHEFGSHVGVMGGGLAVILALISLITNIMWLCIVGIFCIILGAIIPVFYSYIIPKK